MVAIDAAKVAEAAYAVATCLNKASLQFFLQGFLVMPLVAK